MKMDKIRLILVSVLSLMPFLCSAQNLKGHIYDQETEEPLPGVSVVFKYDNGNQVGVVSDVDGAYSIDVPASGVNLLFTCLGYENKIVRIVMSRNEQRVQDVYMSLVSTLLDEVVVSAGRFEQKISDVTVSMEVLKADQISRQAPTDITSTLNTLPGVDVNDRQPSIRGGNGWTYGVGSRCLVLVDGMNALDASNGTVNWNTLPLENIEQVEVMKGASSVLYGSSALNGIINIRSRRPGLTPVTTVKMYMGIYGNPAEDSYQWYDKSFWKNNKYPVEPLGRQSLFAGIRNPFYEGADISHTRRIGNFDVTASMNMFTDEGYRLQGYNQRFRIGGNMTYHHPLPAGKMLNYGFNVNFLSNKSADFFIWRSPGEAYEPSPFANMGREGNNLTLDPFVNFTNTEKNTSHKIKARFHYKDNNIVRSSDNKSALTILGNMGTDFDEVKNLVGQVSAGDYTAFVPIIAPIIKGDLPLAIDNAGSLLGKLFPTATTADYCDLISWVMKAGLPSGTDDLIPWLSGAVNPVPAPTYVDKDFTYYVDYQFNKKWKSGACLTTGLTYEHTTLNSHHTGDHNSDNAAVFLQYDQRFLDKLSVSAGMRVEYYRVDNHLKEAATDIFGLEIPVRPIFRAGLNYQITPYTYLRASFGQGYRYPSLVEKYARKDIGGVGVFPNYDLKPEKGINAEIGLKQGYKFGKVKGFVDVAGFYTQYSDMIEFRFGFFNNDTFEYINGLNNVIAMISRKQTPGIGAQFYNVSKARVYGAEINTTGTVDFADDMNLTYNIGYVFIEPEDVDYKEKNRIESAYTDPLQMKEKSNESKYLKYRQKHSFKTVLDFNWRRLNLGLNLACKSKTLAVDYLMMDERVKETPELMDYARDLLFGISDGENLHSYWNKHNKAYCTLDLRLGVKITDKVFTQFSVNNLLNTEYSTRPMAVAAPRTFIIQLGFKI